MRQTGTWTLAIDVGGTFTDIVVAAGDGRVSRFKTLSAAVDDDSAQLAEAVARLLSDEQRSDVRFVVHATTVATNAILENKGSRVALLTTAGFRDVLEIGRQRMPRLYDMMWERPKPLVRRALRREIDERMAADGDVLEAVDEAEVRAAVGELVDREGVEAIAVCFLNSYANAANEERAAEIARSVVAAPVFTSSDVSPRIKEFERTSTVVANAYVAPIVGRHLERLQESMRENGIATPMYVMKSSGGMMSVEEAAKLPVQIIESGPSAGVVGAREVARELGIPNLLTFDMGGTTVKASVIENGDYFEADELDIGGNANQSGARLGHSGYPVSIPAIFVTEIGAGGGSIAQVDEAGGLQVGPESAGAMPGPSCYRRGGTDATVTDADVVLGYLDAERLGHGEQAIPIDQGLAEAALERQVGAPLGLDAAEAAWAVYQVANVRMARALRAVTIERGRDPRKFDLLVVGGAGPVHGVAIAEHLGIGRVLIPAMPGVFSSASLIMARFVTEAVTAHITAADETSDEAMSELFDRLREQAWAALPADLDREATTEETVVVARYRGQGAGLAIKGTLAEPPTIEGIGERFRAEHRATFGYEIPDPIEFLEYRVRLEAPLSDLGYRALARADLGDAADDGTRRSAYFGPLGWLDVDVVSRGSLAGAPRVGPFAVSEPDTTTLVPPYWRGELDDLGNIVLTRDASSDGQRATATIGQEAP